MDEIGEVVVDIEGNIESGKTAQDYENEIKQVIGETYGKLAKGIQMHFSFF